MAVILVDALAAAAHLTLIYGLPVAPERIRKWAARGHLTRHGRSQRRTLYDLVELETLAARMIRPPAQATGCVTLEQR